MTVTWIFQKTGISKVAEDANRGGVGQGIGDEGSRGRGDLEGRGGGTIASVK